MTELPENSDGAFVSDETSTEHVRFLGAVTTIVADADAADGALTVPEIDAPPGYEKISTPTALASYFTCCR